MKYQKVKGYGAPRKKTTFKDAVSVLGLCLLCVAAVGIALFATNITDSSPKNSTKISSNITDNSEEDIEEISAEPIDESAVLAEVAEREDITEPESTEIINEDVIYETDSVVIAAAPAVEFSPPLKGKINKGYSDKKLVYSKTLEDWRLHTGLDIAAKIGTTVCASADGVVEVAEKDIRYGYTIVIAHTGNLKSVYSNLTGTEMVKVGRDIKRGDPIGMVGDSAICETSDEAHLHFEMKKDDVFVNPLDYFSIN